MKLSLFVSALLPVLVLAAQGPEIRPVEGGPKVPVSGRVLTAGDQPVRGAQISIDDRPGGGSASAQTDAAGRWSIAAAPAGEHWISVHKTGFSDMRRGIRIPASGELKGVDLTLDRPAVLAGRLTDHNNRPLVGAQVIALSESIEEDGPSYRIGARGQPSDDRGWFRLWGLQPGRYVVAVVPSPEPSAEGVVRLGSAIGFYPGVTAVEEASPIELDWGTVREGLDMKLPPPARTLMDVAVTLAGTSSPCNECRLQITASGRAGGVPIPGTARVSGGVFRVEGLPTGEYVVGTMGFNPRTTAPLQAFQEMQIAEGRPESILLEAVSPAPLPVRITLEDPPDELLADGAPPWNVQIRQEPDRGDWHLMTRSREMFGHVQSSESEARLEIATLPGRRKLTLQSPRGAYVSAASLNGRPLDSLWLNPPPEGYQGELALRLRFDGGRFEGAVAGLSTSLEPGLAPPQTLILLEPATPEKGLASLQFQAAQSDGTFAFSAAPGVYNAVAVVQRSGLDPFRGLSANPDLRKRMKRVELKAGETTRLVLDPEP